MSEMTNGPGASVRGLRAASDWDFADSSATARPQPVVPPRPVNPPSLPGDPIPGARVSEPAFDGPTRGQRERAENGAFGHSGNGQAGPTKHTHKEKTHNINLGFKTDKPSGGGSGKGGSGGGGTEAGPDDRHQGDQLIHAIERIEFRSERDIVAVAKAINHLGRELHLILGMRAEEINGVLSTYKGKWYTFGASSRVKARLVSAHLKVSAEAAKALGVGGLKMAHAFDRHFVRPEREAKQRRKGGKAPRKTFSIGDE
ncbi:hypothetical protein ACIG0A_33595 [Streptomyces californicus]|uniref:hypothetical protein n=1 Tax=Streptomyces californicus TaxID=67351 RepID=UPI0037CD5FD6